MAKAFDIEGFDSTKNITECLQLLFKAKTEEIYFYYDQLFSSNDIEILHSARVASRRLQALFKVFNSVFPQKKYLKIYQTVKDFIDLLGTVREYDVLIRMISDYISNFSQKDVKALMLLFAKLKNENLTSRQQLFKKKKIINFKNHKNRIIIFTDKYLLKEKKENPDIIDINLSFKENAILVLPYLYEIVKSFDDKVFNHPRNKVLMHKMRIKAKPLRYTMELYLKTYGDEFKQCYNEIKLFVEKTGDVHDIDIMMVHLEDYIKEIRIYNQSQKSKTERISTRSIREYIKFLKSKRHILFTEVCKLIDKWREEDFKTRLENSIIFIDSVNANIPESTNNITLQD